MGKANGEGKCGAEHPEMGTKVLHRNKNEKSGGCNAGGENVENQGESVTMERKRTYMFRRLEESKEAAKDSSSVAREGRE